MWAMGCSQDQNEEEEGDGDLSSWRRRRILGEQGGIGGCWWGSGCVRVITDLAKILIVCGPLQFAIVRVIW